MFLSNVAGFTFGFFRLIRRTARIIRPTSLDFLSWNKSFLLRWVFFKVVLDIVYRVSQFDNVICKFHQFSLLNIFRSYLITVKRIGHQANIIPIIRAIDERVSKVKLDFILVGVNHQCVVKGVNLPTSQITILLCKAAVEYSLQVTEGIPVLSSQLLVIPVFVHFGAVILIKHKRLLLKPKLFKISGRLYINIKYIHCDGHHILSHDRRVNSKFNSWMTNDPGQKLYITRSLEVSILLLLEIPCVTLTVFLDTSVQKSSTKISQNKKWKSPIRFLI